jgi:hypothetical protein
MPCDTLKIGETIEIKKAKVNEALAKLEKLIERGIVQAVISPTGAVTFRGWNEGRDGMLDACALRKLTQSNSPALRKALLQAEIRAGRKVDQRQIAAGVHSHDGGATWGRG